MKIPELCQAIAQKHVVELHYHWGYRIVEPHVYGRHRDGHELLRAYQIGGQSESHEPVGWKLFRVAEISEVRLLGTRFAGARPGYNANDPGMARIFCEL